MSTIKEALAGLLNAIENLEDSAQNNELHILQIQQQELFNARAATRKISAPPAQESLFAIDPAILTKKLDGTIEKIEQILKEG